MADKNKVPDGISWNDDDGVGGAAGGCDYCARGMKCPYIRVDGQGRRYHQKDGITEYIDDVIIGDRFGIDSNLPNTPKPTKKKHWWE
jgi:hypothetical protein